MKKFVLAAFLIFVAAMGFLFFATTSGFRNDVQAKHQKDTLVVFHRDTVVMSKTDTIVFMPEPKGYWGLPPAVMADSDKVFKIINITKFAFEPDTFLLKKAYPMSEIVTRSFNGSGFFVEGNSFVTAAHIVNLPDVYVPKRWGYKTVVAERYLYICISDLQAIEATVDTIDTDNDVAILVTDKNIQGLSLESRQIKKFEPLWTAGYPDGENGLTITPMQIFYSTQDSSTASNSGQTRDMLYQGHKKVLRYSGGVDHGMSGGPIFTEDGRVVGIVVQTNESCTTAYGTPIEYIKRLLTKK